MNNFMSASPQSIHVAYSRDEDRFVQVRDRGGGTGRQQSGKKDRSNDDHFQKVLSDGADEPNFDMSMSHSRIEHVSNVPQSIFNLIAATLGAGTITFPYSIMMNGIVFGSCLVLFAAFLSYDAGMTIIKCAKVTQQQRFEDIALALYGPKCSRIVGILNLMCLICFTMSYIVYVKTMIPQLILRHTDTAPAWMLDNFNGHLFWGTIFSYCVLFPLSIPNSLNALSWSAIFGVLCSFYLVLAVMGLFFCNRDIVPQPVENIKQAELATVSFDGMVSSFPLVIFAYMYQVNIPMIYVELKDRQKIPKVIGWGSVLCAIMYILIGIFGYLTFTVPPTDLQDTSADSNGYQIGRSTAIGGIVQLEQQQSSDFYDGPFSYDYYSLQAANILEAPYPKKNLVLAIGHYCLMVSVISAAPIVVLPAKEAVTEMLPWTWEHNLKVTFGLVSLCYLLAVFIPNIGSAMTIAGSTTNPALGFLVPMIFYWKVIKKEPTYSWKRIRVLLTCAFIIVVSFMSLYNFLSKAGKEKQ